MASRSKACVYGRSIAGIAGSNSAGGMDVSLMNVVCCQAEISLRRADHASRGDVLSVSKCNSNPLHLQ
jgi:hypothetical protein